MKKAKSTVRNSDGGPESTKHKIVFSKNNECRICGNIFSNPIEARRCEVGCRHLACPAYPNCDVDPGGCFKASDINLDDIPGHRG